ncbi:MAG: hypothetical protein ABSF94_02800 [Steroidobacteraceae bacterium]|jgi:hypothetical protein
MRRLTGALVAKKQLMLMFNTAAARRSGCAPCAVNRCLSALLYLLLIGSTGARAEEGGGALRTENPPRDRAAAPAKPARESPKAAAPFDAKSFPDLTTKFAITSSSMFSTTEFRPHGPSLNATAPVTTAAESVPMLRETNAWDRLADYKSSHGIRLLTLWESPGSTLSVQTGRGGGPSLQWSSRTFGRGEGTHSLLDHLFSTAIGDMQPIQRAGKSTTGNRPAHLFERSEESVTPRHD